MKARDSKYTATDADTLGDYNENHMLRFPEQGGFPARSSEIPAVARALAAPYRPIGAGGQARVYNRSEWELRKEVDHVRFSD